MNKVLIDYLQQNKITKKELAKKCDISMYMLNQVINLNGKISCFYYYKVSKVTGIKIEEMCKYIKRTI